MSKIEIEDLPKAITGSLSRSNKVVLCDRCHGYGFQARDECVDYHKRAYELADAMLAEREKETRDAS